MFARCLLAEEFEIYRKNCEVKSSDDIQYFTLITTMLE